MKEVGQISEEAHNTISEIQETQDNLLKEIGKLEYRKQEILMEVSRLQDVFHKLLDRERMMLKIPEGTDWRIGPDRKIYVEEK